MGGSERERARIGAMEVDNAGPGKQDSRSKFRRVSVGLGLAAAEPGETGFESYWTNHHYDENELKKLRAFENTDYLMEINEPYKQWVRNVNPDPTRQADRWFMMSLVGFVVGLVGFVVHQLIEVLGHIKYSVAKDLLDDDKVGLAWVAYAGISCGFVLISGLLVLFFGTAAAGSGLPEVIGHLNGAMIPHFFSLNTFAGKLLSCVFAVGSGMPVGPEGPMITLGAAVGRGISGMSSRKFGFSLPFFRRLRNPMDRRDFVSAGAGAGVASAFGAPVGGLLFTMEEVSSFWNQVLTWQIFFACMMASFTTDVFNAIVEGDAGEIGGVLFQVTQLDITYHVLICVPAVVLGVIGGVLGVAFTYGNLKVARFRARYLSHSKLLRLLDPLLTALLMSAIVVFLPSLFHCRSCPSAEGDSCFDREDTEVLTYTCDGKTYNEMASLYLRSGHEAIKTLYTRRTVEELGYGSLFAMLLTYFPLACWSAGSLLSTGIVVPMLLIGALYGRIVGVVMVDMFGSSTSGEWDWIDPGLFALIGSASFFGGVSRLTMSLTVIMMELSMDVHLLVPIMLSVVIAKSIADSLTHSMYHALIEVKCIPFLDHLPGTHESLELVPVTLVTRGQAVVGMQPVMRVGDVVALLESCKHNKFPVSNQEGRFVGSVRRDTVRQVLAQRHFSDSNNPSDLDFPLLPFEKLMDHESAVGAPLPALDGQDAEKFVNLAPYLNTSATTVLHSFALERAYILFRTMGLRHLFVLDNDCKCVGVVTRKDLMGFSIEHALEKAHHE